MSLSPADIPERPTSDGISPAVAVGAVTHHPERQSRMWRICFALLAFEIGGFLVVFPWMEAWRFNHFPALYPPLFDIWDDPYFRGAISGFGVVDVLIAIWQTARLLRRPKNS